MRELSIEEMEQIAGGTAWRSAGVATRAANELGLTDVVTTDNDD
ncbi:MAG: hypothetical protein AAFP97_06225 [Pseudomonadota bacterium]